jgi:hypothetical protein
MRKSLISSKTELNKLATRLITDNAKTGGLAKCCEVFYFVEAQNATDMFTTTALMSAYNMYYLYITNNF